MVRLSISAVWFALWRRVLGLLAAVFVLCLQVFAAVDPPQNATIIFKADYENTALNAGVRGISAAKPIAVDAMSIDCHTARAGRCSLLSKVAPAGSYVTADAFRSESDSMAMIAARYSTGDDFGYRFSLLVPLDWQTDSPQSIDIVWQFKRFSSRPDMFVAIKGDSLVLRVTEKQQIVLVSPLPRGEWVDFYFKVHWSSTDDGVVDLSIGDAGSSVARTFQYRGPNMWNAKPKAGYLKWGLYKPGKTDGSMAFAPRTVHHDEIEVYKLEPTRKKAVSHD
jgi:hypothetical protein